MTESNKIGFVELRVTSKSDPESYDIYLNNEKVGTAELSGGMYTVNLPDRDIDMHIPSVKGNDEFEDDETRVQILTRTVELVNIMYSDKKGN